MKKLGAITLTFLFSITVIISGASGYSDCKVKCMRELAKAHPQAMTGPVSLRVPDCCSGSVQKTCEMNSAPPLKIPVCTTVSTPTVFAYIFGFGLISINAESDAIRTSRVNLHFIAGRLNKTPPIYLHTLTLLC